MAIGFTNAQKKIGTDVSDTTAIASDVLASEDFYLANGTKATGTMPTYSGSTEITENATLETEGKYLASDIVVNVSGTSEITGETDITAVAGENISAGDRVIQKLVYNGLVDPSTLPIGTGYSCAYNNDSTRLAVGHASSPFITIYDTTTTPYTKLANPNTRPSGAGRGCAYNNDGTRLAVAHDTTPYITIYDTTTTPYTKLDDPSTPPSSTGYGCAYNNDGTRLAVAHQITPFITIYDTENINKIYKRLSILDKGALLLTQDNKYGYAPTAITIGNSGTIKHLFGGTL